MSVHLTIGVDENGNLMFVDSEAASFLCDLGEVTKQRASHVEPDNALLRVVFHFIRKNFGEQGKFSNWTRNWKCLWRVDMRPSNGPIFGHRYADRKEAIAAEVIWLEEEFI